MINLLKRLPILNKIRIRKRLNYYVYRYMLSEKQVILGENNPNCKHDLVTKQLKKYPTKSLELRNKIDHIYANANITTNQNELFIDICFCFFAYGYSPNEYVCYDFKNKSTEERRAFISDRESVCYGYRMNDIESMHVFMNKMRTYEKYCEYYKRDAISISKIQDKEKFLDFINRHNIFIKKEVNESCGRSIELINMNNSNLGAEELFSTFLSKGEIILEERVVQDTIMNQ